MSASVLVPPSVCLDDKVAEWPPLGRELLFRLTVCFFVFSFIVILFISHFGFEGGPLVLIALVIGHRLSFTFFH